MNYERLHSNIKIYQYQEITPSMAVTTVSKVSFNRKMDKANNNFLSEKNVT